jgi:hypothetical protein
MQQAARSPRDRAGRLLALNDASADLLLRGNSDGTAGDPEGVTFAGKI